MIRLYLKAFATEQHPSPGVCLVRMDAEAVVRLQTLSAMVRNYSLESLGDMFCATWRDAAWESPLTLVAPQMFASRTQCWWSAEVITAQGSASLYTERVDIARLLQTLRDCTRDVLYYTEDDSESVPARLARFEIGANET